MTDFTEALKLELKATRDKYFGLKEHYPDDDGYFLEIKMNKGKYAQFYKCKIKGKGSAKRVERTFIKKQDTNTIKRLAQKEYDSRLLSILENRMEVLESTIKVFEANSEEKLYNKLGNVRKMLIESEYMDDDSFLLAWNEQYSCGEDVRFKEHFPIDTPYYTDKGEHVRSKSEKIIADKLIKENVPYIYEPICEINRSGLHPDFVLLNKRTRQTFFYEHFGMMDNSEYATAATKKIQKYRKMGFEYGKNFIFTFETQSEGLNTESINYMINEYLK